METNTELGSLAVCYVKTIGLTNNGDNGRGFANPVSLAVSGDNRIFVLNRCDAITARAIRIGICNLDEQFLGEFGDGTGEGDTQFKLPTALAFDSQERLHITDEGFHRVTVFDSNGVFLYKWGKYGDQEGQLNGPSGIAFDSGGNSYVVDQHNHRVQKFTDEGQFILQWGEYGIRNGQFNMPWGVTVDLNDNVYVADWRNDRIQKFSTTGNFIGAFGVSGVEDGCFNRPSDVAVDSAGYIYVADWGNHRVQVFRSDGSFEVKLRGEATLSKWAEEFFASNPDELFEREKSNLMPDLPTHLMDSYSISSQTESYFWGPVSVTFDGQSRLYVTESNRHRFQVYQVG